MGGSNLSFSSKQQNGLHQPARITFKNIHSETASQKFIPTWWENFAVHSKISHTYKNVRMTWMAKVLTSLWSQYVLTSLCVPEEPHKIVHWVRTEIAQYCQRNTNISLPRSKVAGLTGRLTNNESITHQNLALIWVRSPKKPTLKADRTLFLKLCWVTIASSMSRSLLWRCYSIQNSHIYCLIV